MLNVLGFYCCYKTPWPKETWGKRLISPYILQPFMKGNQGRNYGQARGAGTRAGRERLLTGLFPLVCSFCLLMLLRTTQAFPHQLSIKKIIHRLAYSPIIWGHCFSLISLFSADSSLCKVDEI